MATLPCNQVEEDQMLLFSQHYSDLYTQMPQGEKRVRRRRKKAKEEERGMGWKKRRLSAEQVKFLEMNFGSEHKLESARKDMLAVELGLDPRQVAVWFQNRRARWKNKQLEEEYAKLKVEHEAIVVEKCQLQDEVLKLREELSDAHKEISKLSQQSDAASEGEGSGSHWSSFSLELHQPFLAEFGVEDAQDFFYIPQVEIGNYFGAMNLLDFYGIGM